MRLLVLGSAFCLSLPALGQADPATITFHFERAPGVLPVYTFQLHPDGTGTYSAQEPPTEGAAGQFNADLHVSPKTAAAVFAQAHQLHLFQTTCASNRKGIADSGAKTLTYAGPDGAGSCAYHYTENKTVDALTNTFQGMALTLDDGRMLGIKHRYDRLGLDGTMTELFTAVNEGHALELGNIAAELTALADDTEVLDRVRERAATLLHMVDQP